MRVRSSLALVLTTSSWFVDLVPGCAARRLLNAVATERDRPKNPVCDFFYVHSRNDQRHGCSTGRSDQKSAHAFFSEQFRLALPSVDYCLVVISLRLL